MTEDNNLRILLVDDDDDIRDVFGDFLREKGHTVYEAKNGDQAVEVAERETPDVVFMDVMMPVKNGYEASRLIRSSEKARRAIIVMLTVRDSTNDKLSAYLSGANRFMSKPCDLDDLENCLKTIARQSKGPNGLSEDESATQCEA